MAVGAKARVLPALALVASGCGVLPLSSQEAALPPPPPVVEGVPDPIPPPPADGLHRFIVWPPGTPVPTQTQTQIPTQTQTAQFDPGDPFGGAIDGSGGGEVVGGEAMGATGTGTGDDTEAQARPQDPVWTIERSLVDRIDDDTVVVVVDGVPGFHDIDGTFIPLVGMSSASTGRPVTPAPDPMDGSDAEARSDEPATEDDVVADLLAIEHVVSAVAVGDGSFAVATEEPDALADQGFAIIVDTPFALAEDPFEPYQWALDNDGINLVGLDNPPAQVIDADIDGLEAKAGARGEGVVVAVIDTGVDFSHPDLIGQSWVNENETCNNLIDDDGNGFVDDCLGWDFGNEDNRPWGQGQQEHGTHVAGTIAARGDNGVGVVGMAPDVAIMDLNVEGPGGMTLSGIARAVRYAADNGADIINMSLGTQPGTPAFTVQSLIDAVAYAESKGVLVVAAAGNSGSNLDQAAVYPASIELPNMLTVGASAPDDTKARFSNFGSAVDVFAPGVLIVSTVPGGYKFMNGTSMAAPTAAGAAAAVLSADPELTPAQVRAQLVGSADRPPAFAGLAANPVRINQAWALGIAGDPQVAQVSVSGLAGLASGEIVADITLSRPSTPAPEPYGWEATLVAIVDEQAYGILDHPVEIDWRAEETDDRGAVTIADGGGERARLETTLPPGTYGLVVEAVPEADPTTRLGQAFVTTFVVPAEPPPEDPTTTVPTTVPGGSTTTGPGTSTTVPGGTTTSTTATANPSTTVPGTTSPSTGSTAPGPTTPTTAVGPVPTTGTTSSPGVSTTAPPGSTTTSGTWSTLPWTPPTTGSPTPTTGSPTTSAPTSAPTTTQPTNPTTTNAPSGGGSPSTTAPPATTATTAAPTTTAATSSTTFAPPTTSVENGFALHTITPNFGAIGEQTMVSIDGIFPSEVYVWFGDQPGDIVYQSGNWIIVVAPAAGDPGPVDVTLRLTGQGTVLTAAGGFSYVGPGDPPPTTTPGATTSTTSGGGATTTSTAGTGGGGTTSTPTGSPTTVPGGGTTPTTSPGGGSTDPTTSPTTAPTGSSTTSPGSGPTTTSGGPGSSTTSAPGSSTPTTTGASTTSTSAPTTTTIDPEARAEPRALSIGAPLDLGGGLSGVPLRGLGGLGSVPPCTSDPCRSSRL